MIVQERITIENQNFIKTYSNSKKYIHKIGTNEFYIDAIDLINNKFQYEETNIVIENKNIESK